MRLFGVSSKPEWLSVHSEAVLFLYGCGSGGCGSEKRGVSGQMVRWGVGPTYQKGSLPLSHPPLSVSEWNMSPLLHAEAWDGVGRKPGTP